MVQLCDNGCGNPAKFYSKETGRHRCMKSANSCPAKRKQNSNALKEHHAKSPGFNGVGQKGIMRGWEKFSELERKALNASSAPKVREYWKNRAEELESDKGKLTYYRSQARFVFGNDPDTIRSILNYELLKQYGMYSKHSNPQGVVRDHRYSVYEGFINKVDPEIISHPANCQFLLHSDNARKTRRSSITLEQLMEDINGWNVRVLQLVDRHG